MVVSRAVKCVIWPAERKRGDKYLNGCEQSCEVCDLARMTEDLVHDLAVCEGRDDQYDCVIITGQLSEAVIHSVNQ